VEGRDGISPRVAMHPLFLTHHQCGVECTRLITLADPDDPS
jgi:hypothetical protein